MNRLKVLSYASFFAALIGCFYIGGIFINYNMSASSLTDLSMFSTPAFIFVYVLPIVVTAITALGAFFLLFRDSARPGFIRCGLLGVTIVQVFALLILIAWLLTSTGISFFLYLLLAIALVVIYIKLFTPLSPKYTILLEFLVVGLFLSSWYSSMVANYCARNDAQGQVTESCTNSAYLTTVVSSEVKRIFNR